MKMIEDSIFSRSPKDDRILPKGFGFLAGVLFFAMIFVGVGPNFFVRVETNTQYELSFKVTYIFYLLLTLVFCRKYPARLTNLMNTRSKNEISWIALVCLCLFIPVFMSAMTAGPLTLINLIGPQKSLEVTGEVSGRYKVYGKGGFSCLAELQHTNLNRPFRFDIPCAAYELYSEGARVTFPVKVGLLGLLYQLKCDDNLESSVE